MKHVTLSLFLFLLGTYFAQAGAPVIKNVVQYENKQSQTIELPTHFAQPFIIDQKDIDLLKGKTIHHVELIYTEYAESATFNQKALNNRRISQLKQLLPQVNADQPTWTWVEQTGAKTRDVANQYFHGFVIHYGDKLDHNELGSFLSDYSGNKNAFEVYYPEGGSFSVGSGTRITIDPKAVSYMDGSPVSGYYTLYYSEYRNPADIALSGLPMNYEDANFSSVGMYELRAEKDGKPLKLIEPMKVDFNCTKIVDDAAFFSMDDQTGEWTKHHDIEFSTNRVSKVAQANAVIAPDMAFAEVGAWNMSMTSQQLDDKRTQIKVDENAWLNYKQLNKNEQPKGIISCDSANRTFIVETKHYDHFQQQILVNRIPVRNWKRTNSPRPNDIKQTLLAEGSSDPGHTYPTIVKGLNSPNFGVYNCDQVYRIGESAQVKPIYIDTKTGETIKNGHVACVMDLSYNGSFSFHPNHLTLNKKGKNAVLLFTDQKEIFLIDEEAFARLDLEGGQHTEFPMKDVTKELKSSNDLRKLLDI